MILAPCLYRHWNNENHSFISFILGISTVSEFHAEEPQAAASEKLAQSLYVAARAGFEPETLRSKGVEATNEPPRPTRFIFV